MRAILCGANGAMGKLIDGLLGAEVVGRVSIDGENGVIGFFEDGSIYLVNRDFINDNTFTLHTDKPLSVLSDDRFIPVDDCVITVELGAGEAVLLKV